MNSTLENLFDKFSVVPLDGAWGTELSNRGLPAGETPEKWNLDFPEKVAEIPEAYAKAGAIIVITNTFGGSKFKLEKAGLGDKVEEVNKSGAEISKNAVKNIALVFASVGPTGEFLQPLGLTSKEEMEDVFCTQISALKAGGADGIVIETMTDLEEANCALKAAKKIAPELPVVVSITYDKGANGYATMMGITPERAAKFFDDAGADIIGTNCGNGIENMIEVVGELRKFTNKPIWARPNAGMPQLINGKTVFPATPEEMAEKVPELISAGANMIGGCCGTSPEHIKAISKAIKDCI